MTRLAILAAFTFLLAAAAALEVAARAGVPGTATLGRVVGPALRDAPVRAAAVAAWLWAGWHVFVR